MWPARGLHPDVGVLMSHGFIIGRASSSESSFGTKDGMGRGSGTVGKTSEGEAVELDTIAGADNKQFLFEK